jgi:hypothetical protein
MSQYSKKNVTEPLLFDGGDGEAQPEHTGEKPAGDGGILTRQQINQCMMDLEDMHPL